MKTLKTLIAVILLSGFTQTSQAQYLDLGVLAGGVAYQKFADQPKMDNVLHFWGAYFGTVAVSELLKKWDAPRSVQIIIPVIAGILAVGFKEYLDQRTCYDDVRAGLFGVGAATIRISFKL